MKTTIELPDALAREAKEFARERGTTLRDLVVEGQTPDAGRISITRSARIATLGP